MAAGASGDVELTAPAQPGTYTFYCPVWNHRQKGMEGKLIVRSKGE